MGIRVKYDEILTLLSIFKGTVDINWNGLGKCEMRVLLMSF